MTLARFVANSNRRPGIGDVMARLWALIVLGRRSTMGHRVCVYGRPIIDSAGELVIGSRTQIFARQARTELVVEASATLSIGEQCLVMDGDAIAATELVEIGDRVLIGRGVSIIDNGYHELAVGRRLERPASQRVRIGNDVWIGTRAMVLPGHRRRVGRWCRSSRCRRGSARCRRRWCAGHGSQSGAAG
ncbi:MAG: hypothetical protein R2710_22770 [Acidimicrobiales bacterium]